MSSYFTTKRRAIKMYVGVTSLILIAVTLAGCGLTTDGSRNSLDDKPVFYVADDGNGSTTVPEILESNVAETYAIALNLDANELNSTLEIIQEYATDRLSTEEYIADFTNRRGGRIPSIGDIIGDRLGSNAANLNRESTDDEGNTVTLSYRDEIRTLTEKYNGHAKALRPTIDELKNVPEISVNGDNIVFDRDILIKNDGDIENTINLLLIIAESRNENITEIFQELKTVAENRGVQLGTAYNYYNDHYNDHDHGDTLLNNNDASEEGYQVAKAFYSKRRTNLWKNGIIRYRWDDSIIPEHKAALIKAMNEWEAGVGSNSIQFLDVTNQTNPFAGGAVVDYKTGEANGFGWAIIGTYNDLTKPTELVLDYRNTRENYKGKYADSVVEATALHEIGHVIGAWHEHQRYDRDKYIIVSDDNRADTTNYGRVPYYNYAMGAERKDRVVRGVHLGTILFTPDNGKNTIGSPNYDISSIMHYNGFLLKRDVVGCNGVTYLKSVNSPNKGRSPYISTLSPCDGSAVYSWYVTGGDGGDGGDGGGMAVLTTDVAKVYRQELTLDANEINETLAIIQSYATDSLTSDGYLADYFARTSQRPTINNVITDRLAGQTQSLSREGTDDNGNTVTLFYTNEMNALQLKYDNLRDNLRPSDDDLRSVAGIALTGERITLDKDILINNDGSIENTIKLRLIIAEDRNADLAKIFREMKTVAKENGVVFTTTGNAIYADGLITSKVFYDKKRTNLWKDGIVRYRWDSSIIPEHKTALIKAMNEWTTATGGNVQFVNVTNVANPLAGGFVVDYRTGNAGGFGLANIGTGTNQNHINTLTLDSKNTVANYRGTYPDSVVNATALHELGHVLGAWHEHQRYDRDDYIVVSPQDAADTTNYGEIPLYNFAGGAEIKVRIVGGVQTQTPLFTYNDIQRTVGSPNYDVSSIMHYNVFALKKDVVGCNGITYFQSTNSFNHGRAPYIDTLSPCDGSAVRNWYSK